MKIEINNYSFYMTPKLKSNLDIVLKHAIPNNWDALFMIWGREGSGKSTLATQMSLYLDHSFDIKRCVFTVEQFINAIENSEQEQAILWDEAVYGAKAAQHATSISQAIVNKLTVIREKKLKLILCFPYLYMLNKYFVTRCLASVLVYAKDFDDRGYMRFYDSRKTEYIYNLMKGKFRYNWLGAVRKVKPSFNRKYANVFCLPFKEYTKKKRASSSEEMQGTDMYRARLKRLLKYIDATGYKPILNKDSMSQLMNMPKGTITRLVNE